MIYYLLAFFVAQVVTKAASIALWPETSNMPHDSVALIRNGLLILVAFALYAAAVRVVERRPATEVAPLAGVRQFPVGVVLGVALVGLAFGVLWTLGAAQFAAGPGGAGLLRAAAYPTAVALLEELLFRVILFGMFEQMAGSAAALILSTALFALAHAGNPGATPFDLWTLALGLGTVLPLAYVLTRNIGFAAGVHMGWNFAQGYIFGAQVSGLQEPSSLLRTQLSGPDWLTGGAFGIEGSALTAGVCLCASTVIFVLAVRRGAWRGFGIRMSARPV
jgi:membrane protease YdiL (CAAX protease family)